MGKLIDITGQIFGRWTVLGRAENGLSDRTRWNCKCICGKELVVGAKDLRTGHSKSCGCQRRDHAMDLKGEKFGKWTVLEQAGFDSRCQHLWHCQCECGTKSVVTHGSLRNGRSRSCGCLRKEKMTKHKMSKQPEYRAWAAMKNRCKSPNNFSYSDYGGRGIQVCELLKTFDNFYKDLGPRPSKEYSIDRIDNNANYSCGHCDECKKNGWAANCRWATRVEQINNRRPFSQWKKPVN